jgi:hypothetical protein
MLNTQRLFVFNQSTLHGLPKLRLAVLELAKVVKSICKRFHADLVNIYFDLFFNKVKIFFELNSHFSFKLTLAGECVKDVIVNQDHLV